MPNAAVCLERYVLSPFERIIEDDLACMLATRDYHPHRFARRDAEIRTLVTEVFLSLVKAQGEFREAEGAERSRARRESLRERRQSMMPAVMAEPETQLAAGTVECAAADIDASAAVR